MDIQLTPKKTDGVERLIQVSVAAKDVAELEAKATRRYVSQARMPGFRPGKAPAPVVKKRFADAIRQETIEAVVREAYQTVLEREQLKVVAQPHIHHLHWHDGEAMTFELHLEVRPEVALDKLSGFRIARGSTAVTDADIDAQLDRLRDQRSNWVPKDGKADPGDMVTVDLAAAGEDGTLPEGKEYRLVIGEGQAIAGVEELVLEAKPGETIERPVKWPDDFPDAASAGKTKLVRVTLKDVKRKEAPALDDAFAASVGDFDSLAALRETVAKDLARHAEQEADSQLRANLMEQIIAANPFDLPPSWVGEVIGRYLEAYQVPKEDQEKFADEFKPIAERQVRRDVIVELIAERQQFVPTEADVDDRIQKMAEERKVPAGQLYGTLQKAGRLPALEREILEERVFAWLLTQNTVE
ncbi:MAG: trigger factor [Gemmatimonadaceae bacterium]|nr:trigger factor [Gemmatimonadaceae bacterium]